MDKRDYSINPALPMALVVNCFVSPPSVEIEFRVISLGGVVVSFFRPHVSEDAALRDLGGPAPSWSPSLSSPSSPLQCHRLGLPWLGIKTQHLTLVGCQLDPQ